MKLLEDVVVEEAELLLVAVMVIVEVVWSEDGALFKVDELEVRDSVLEAVLVLKVASRNKPNPVMRIITITMRAETPRETALLAFTNVTQATRCNASYLRICDWFAVLAIRTTRTQCTINVGLGRFSFNFRDKQLNRGKASFYY